MIFGEPRFLYALILVPLVALFVLWANARARADLSKLGNPTLIDKLSQTVSHRGRRWKTFLWFAATTLLIVALARPQWGSEVQMVEQQGLEVMVALDVSQSMLAEDIKPSRLSRAKLEIVDLMERLTGDEVGLVVFSGASFIQFPLTSDFATARSFLDSANPGIISQPGTSIDGAIKTALTGFNWERASQKVIVIMTDGENHQTDPLPAARQAAERGVIIYTIGFGTVQGAPIPQYNAQGEVEGYKKDRQGETVLSKLDEVTMQKIALAANGQYWRASGAGKEMAALAAELETMQKDTLENRFESRHIERFQGFLLTSLALLVLVEAIPDRRRIR